MIDDEQELSYAEILSAVILNSEVTITVLNEDVEKIKTGLKNLKAKQAQKLKEEGLLPPTETLEFQSTENREDEDFTDLRIILRARATVKIKKITYPDNNF